MLHYVLSLTLLLAVGCQSQPDSPATEPVQNEAVPAAEPAERAADALAGQPPTVRELTPADEAPAAPARQLTRNATLRYRVENRQAAGERAGRLVRAFGGYVSAHEDARIGDTWQTTLTARVPAARLDAFVDSLLTESIYTDAKTITAEDVTKQLVDTEARIRTRKATEETYRQLLKRAKTVQDVLAVEEQLAQLRESIEVAEAEVKTLRSNVALSTVNAVMYEVGAATREPQAPVLSRLGQNLRDGLRLVGDVVVGLVYLLPTLALIAGIGWAVRWVIRRQRTT